MIATLSPKPLPAIALPYPHPPPLQPGRHGFSHRYAENLPTHARDSIHFSGWTKKRHAFSSALENKDNWRDRLGKWQEKKSLQAIQAFENTTLWIKKAISTAMMVLAAILSGVPMPESIKKFIHRKFFFAPPKISSIHLLNSEELKQNILEVNFHPKGKKTPSLNGWYIEAQKGKPTIVFSHGRHCNISQHEPLLNEFRRKGYGIFIYDYPGFGRSEGKPTEQALYEAGLSASKFLARDGVAGLGIPYCQQIIMGHSLGGAVAVDVAKKLSQDERTKPMALVVINSFTDIKEAFGKQKQTFNRIIQKLFDEGKIGLEFNSLAKIKNVQVPVMVTHGLKDRVIHSDLGKTLMKSYKSTHPEYGPLVGKFYPMANSGHFLNEKTCQNISNSLDSFLREVERKAAYRLA